MSMLSDAVKLKEDGFSTDEIRQMIFGVKTPEPKPEEPKEVPTVEKPIEVEEATKEEPEVDYKALYEESQQKLQEAQKANINQNIKPEESTTPQDELNELIKSFM